MAKPNTITRTQITEACKILGLDPREVCSLSITSNLLTVSVYQFENGQLLVDDLGHWTAPKVDVHLYQIQDEIQREVDE